MLLNKSAFLNRDGIISNDKAFVHRWHEFEFLLGSVEGMQGLQRASYPIVIVTDQSSLARDIT